MILTIFDTVKRSWGYETLVNIVDVTGIYNFCIDSEEIISPEVIEKRAIELTERAIIIAEEAAVAAEEEPE